MLTLVIARHAKSDWTHSIDDHGRPLNERGLRQAPLLGHRMLNEGICPTLIISSDARRAEETALLIQTVFEHVPIVFDHRLYLGNLDNIAQVVSQQKAQVSTIVVVGHNPGFSAAAALLGRCQVDLKTAYAAVLQSSAQSWGDAFEQQRFDFVTMVYGRE